ncbi:MAG: hypothetical protein HYW50_05150 [Candidatus Diapherotrites archaeon]|nr:hypothetical protein [Candidatus Diapherotrites archaeon]
MIAEIKKFWLYALAFIALNFALLFFASLLSLPVQTEDITAPLMLFFQIIIVISSFFPSLLVTLALSRKTKNFGEQFTVVFFSALVFSILIAGFSIATVMLFEEQEWEKGYLDAVLVLPEEISFEQFKALTFFEILKEFFSATMQNLGAAFFGLAAARKIFGERAW